MGLYKYFYEKLGWKIKGTLPTEKKYLIIVAPHTSNWDFMVGLCVRSILKFNPQYVAKKELFVWPIGGLFRKLGGYPVERSKNSNLVQSIVDIYNKEETFILTITPEGTRSKNDDWKTGFFHIAQQANVLILPVAFDYSTKTVVLGETKRAEGDVHEFVDVLKSWFTQFKGRNPEDGV
ncbi:MAG: 1-acyl-sn-glycerol-3-phosphate acyltransferase [Bacteroidia bacterium]|jgi:1-acyl-sn-glycerol-3-phosphate acyltransferase